MLNSTNNKDKCCFMFKTGNQCNKNCVKYSNKCYLKSHYKSEEEYKEVFENIKKNFEKQTIEIDKNNIIKTIPDGACMYYSISIFLIKNNKKIIKNNNKELYNEELQDIYNEIIIILELLNNNDYENKTDNFYKITHLIQKIAVKYLIINKDNNSILYKDFSYKYKQLVCDIHELSSFEEYDKYFDIFAGDNDYIIDEDNGKKKEIPERWGSNAELEALFLIFNINISIYECNKLENLESKKCTTKTKQYRLKNIANILNDKNNYYINLIMENNHYILYNNINKLF